MFKHTVFSPVRGQVLLAGLPVAQCEVVQRYDWLGMKKGEARATTDSEGRFSFPAITVRKLRARDVLIVQDLEVVHAGQKISLWNLTRQSTGMNDELGGQPLVLIADLDQPPQEYKIPVAADRIAEISGVGRPDVPFISQLAALRAQVTEGAVAQALLARLRSVDARQHLDSFFPSIGGARTSVRDVARVDGVELSDWSLYQTAEPPAYAVHEVPGFIGFTTRAQVGLVLDSGEELTCRFFAWTVFLPVTEGRPVFDARLSERWEIDVRDFVKRQVEHRLDRGRVAATMLERVQREPWPELRAAFGLEANQPGPAIVSVDLSAVEVLHVVRGAAGLSVAGELTFGPEQRSAVHRFRGYLPVQIGAMEGAAYALAEGDAPRFQLVRFNVRLRTDKPVYAPGETVMLEFTVENLLEQPSRFLKWHTPFEGFRNDYLAIRHAGSTEDVPYSGALVSRAPPGEDSYLVLGPRESATSHIDVTEAYPLSEKGTYSLAYKGIVDGVQTDSTTFSVT